MREQIPCLQYAKLELQCRLMKLLCFFGFRLISACSASFEVVPTGSSVSMLRSVVPQANVVEVPFGSLRRGCRVQQLPHSPVWPRGSARSLPSIHAGQGRHASYPVYAGVESLPHLQTLQDTSGFVISHGAILNKLPVSFLLRSESLAGPPCVHQDERIC